MRLITEAKLTVVALLLDGGCNRWMINNHLMSMKTEHLCELFKVATDKLPLELVFQSPAEKLYDFSSVVAWLQPLSPCAIFLVTFAVCPPSFLWMQSSYYIHSQSPISPFTNKALSHLCEGICVRIVFHCLSLESPPDSHRQATISMGNATITSNGSHFLGFSQLEWMMDKIHYGSFMWTHCVSAQVKVVNHPLRKTKFRTWVTTEL